MHDSTDAIRVIRSVLCTLTESSLFLLFYANILNKIVYVIQLRIYKYVYIF